MADENEVVEATEEEIREAESLGWAPKDKWRGDEGKWVDAKTFLEKGRHILPIMQENNRRLKGEVGTLSARLSETEEALRAANAAIAAIQESQEDDVKAQVAAAREELKAEIARASREGDHDALADATVKLSELDTADADSDKKGDKGDTPPQPRMHPEVVTWFKENPDFVNDKRRVALANAVAAELREQGEKSVGKAFMDLVAEEVEKTLGPVRGRTSKSEGGNGGTGRRGDPAGGGKSYADLPEEAKKQCERQAARLVGPNRAHKTIESWRSSYARQYFAE